MPDVNIIVTCDAPVKRWVLGDRDGTPVAVVNGRLPDDELAAAVIAARHALLDAAQAA